MLLSIFQESVGRLATILFAHRLGTSLEPECKFYRLLADIFNDVAMLLDCLSPVFPKKPRIIVLSTSGVLRALCGVAAGGSKASLSAHFALSGNLAELNAVSSLAGHIHAESALISEQKDSSQEVVVSLLGMMVRRDTEFCKDRKTDRRGRQVVLLCQESHLSS